MSSRSAHNVARGILNQKLGEAIAERTIKEAEYAFEVAKSNTEGKTGEDFDKWVKGHKELGTLLESLKTSEEKLQKAIDAYNIHEILASKSRN